MSLRARIVLYLAAIHLTFAGIAVLVLRQAPLWLFAVELFFATSLGVGLALTNRVLRGLALGREAATLIRSQELTSRVRPVGDPNVDALIGVYNTMVDTLREERVRAEEQHHFLSLVLSASPSGVVILDFDRRLATLNPAAERLLGVERADALGQPLAALQSPLAATLATLLPGNSVVAALSGPRRVRCHHGRFIDRGFTRSFLVLEELTEEARQFERSAYEKLIRVMSHEVNNSVTASNSLLRSALTYRDELRTESRADFEQALTIVIDRTEELAGFMRRFADVFRLPPPIRAIHNLQELVAPIVRLMSARPESADVEWCWIVDPMPVTVSVDRGQFEQAVLNIMQNALEAAGPHGVVTVRIRSVHGRPTLEIEDSGPGPGVEAEAHLFTPFFSTKSNGQGIGLTLVQEVLIAHGFAFALDHPPGGPTRFVVRM